MSKILPTRARLLAVALIAASAPGLLLAAPSDRDDRRSDRRERRTEVRDDHRGRSVPRAARRAEARHDHRREVRRDRRSEVRPEHRHHGHRHTRDCGCVERIRAGYYKTVLEEIRTPGYYERVWVPAKRIRLGRHVNVEFCEGHYERVWVPGEVRTVERRVWVPAERVVERTCRRHAPRHCD